MEVIIVHPLITVDFETILVTRLVESASLVFPVLPDAFYLVPGIGVQRERLILVVVALIAIPGDASQPGEALAIRGTWKRAGGPGFRYVEWDIGNAGVLYGFQEIVGWNDVFEVRFRCPTCVWDVRTRSTRRSVRL